MKDFPSSLQVSVYTLIGGMVSYFGYITPEEGDTYALKNLNTDAWSAASRSNQVKAIIGATRSLNNIAYFGDKSLCEQILEFPRNGESVIPEAIKFACFLEAVELLDGRDIEEELLSLNVQSDKYSQISTTYSEGRNFSHILAGILSYKAWAAITPYMRDPQEIQLNRVS